MLLYIQTAIRNAINVFESILLLGREQGLNSYFSLLPRIYSQLFTNVIKRRIHHSYHVSTFLGQNKILISSIDSLSLLTFCCSIRTCIFIFVIFKMLLGVIEEVNSCIVKLKEINVRLFSVLGRKESAISYLQKQENVLEKNQQKRNDTKQIVPELLCIPCVY